MKKKEAKEIARKLIQDQLARAYYSLFEGFEYEKYTKEEKELINKQLEKEATRMLKLIDKDYITY